MLGARAPNETSRQLLREAEQLGEAGGVIVLLGGSAGRLGEPLGGC